MKLLLYTSWDLMIHSVLFHWITDVNGLVRLEPGYEYVVSLKSGYRLTLQNVGALSLTKTCITRYEIFMLKNKPIQGDIWKQCRPTCLPFENGIDTTKISHVAVYDTGTQKHTKFNKQFTSKIEENVCRNATLVISLAYLRFLVYGFTFILGYCCVGFLRHYTAAIFTEIPPSHILS